MFPVKIIFRFEKLRIFHIRLFPTPWLDNRHRNPPSSKADRSGRLLKTRAFAAQMLEDHPTAISSYEMLVALDPGDWESWNNLGNSRREQGDAVGSIAALRRAIEIEPRSPPVWLNLATALVAGAHFEDAEQQLRKMAEDFPADEKPLRELHALYQQQMRDEEALEAIEGAVKRAPDKVDLWLALEHSIHRLRRHVAVLVVVQQGRGVLAVKNHHVDRITGN